MRGGDLADRLKRPPFTAILDRHPFQWGRSLAAGGGVSAWIGRAGCNPLLEVGDDRIGEFAGGRHLQMRVGVADGLQQAAPGGLARNDNRTGRAAFRKTSFGIEDEPAHRGFQIRGVAGVTLRCPGRGGFWLRRMRRQATARRAAPPGRREESSIASSVLATPILYDRGFGGAGGVESRIARGDAD